MVASEGLTCAVKLMRMGQALWLLLGAHEERPYWEAMRGM